MPIISTTLTLKDLPSPPSGKNGWPWTEQTQPLPDIMADGSLWPRISIVTPSYNQGEFIEETIRSVLLQGYPNLEYIIIDGGSTDNTIDIIKKYEQYIAYWISEPDEGQSNALNKGFRKATGDLIGWQNSDDYYRAEAFKLVAEASVEFKNADIFYGEIDVIERGKVIEIICAPEFNLEQTLPWFRLGNQAMFFRSKVFQEGYSINEKYHHFMDFEFFWQLIVAGYEFKFIPGLLGYIRVQPNSKALRQADIAAKELFETYKVPYLCKNNAIVPKSFKQKLLSAIKGACLDNFTKLRLELFRYQVLEIISLSGLEGMDIELYLKYFLSFLGNKPIVQLKSIKNLLNLPVRSPQR